MEGSPVRQLVVSLALLLATPVLADTLKLQDNAPDSYVVVKGDTLWDISDRFLKDPWRWPQIWNLNREEIKNPHWIYPGDMIVLDRSGKEPRLSLVKGDKSGMQTVKLTPAVRTANIQSAAIPAIPINAIQTDPDNGELLGHEAEYLGDAETVAPGTPQKLRITRVNQEIFSQDKLIPAREYTQFEFVPHAPERPISGKVISAYGTTGQANAGRYQTVVINRGTEDGLEPGHVLAVYRAGKVVKMDKDGRTRWVYLDSGCIKPGEKASFDQFYEPSKVMEDCKPSVEVQAGPWAYMDLGCLKPGKKVSFDQFFDPKEVYDRGCTDKKHPETMQLPDARTGLVMVYRVFDRVSYALIMQSERPVYLLDTVKNP